MMILQKFRQKAVSPRKLADPGLIGLDIDNGRIHLCQIRPRDNGVYGIMAKATVRYDGSRGDLLASPTRLKSLIGEGLRERNFVGNHVAALVPWDDVKIFLLTHEASVKDVESEVLRMLESRVDGSIEDYVVDYVPVRSNPSDEEHLVIATVAGREKVNALLEALAEVGLQVGSLDIAPTALRRIVSALYTGHAADNVLMINTYCDDSYLTVISGRRLLYTQSVEFGETLLLQRISEELNIDRESALRLVIENGLERQQLLVGDEAASNQAATLLEIVKPCFLDLAEEINRVLELTASETHRVPFSRVCLLGGIGYWPGAQQLLLSLLDLDVPSAQIEFSQVFEDENENTRVPWSGLFCEISIAMGLALRGLVDK